MVGGLHQHDARDRAVVDLHQLLVHPGEEARHQPPLAVAGEDGPAFVVACLGGHDLVETGVGCRSVGAGEHPDVPERVVDLERIPVAAPNGPTAVDQSEVSREVGAERLEPPQALGAHPIAEAGEKPVGIADALDRERDEVLVAGPLLVREDAGAVGRFPAGVPIEPRTAAERHLVLHAPETLDRQRARQPIPIPGGHAIQTPERVLSHRGLSRDASCRRRAAPVQFTRPFPGSKIGAVGGDLRVEDERDLIGARTVEEAGTWRRGW